MNVAQILSTWQDLGGTFDFRLDKNQIRMLMPESHDFFLSIWFRDSPRETMAVLCIGGQNQRTEDDNAHAVIEQARSDASNVGIMRTTTETLNLRELSAEQLEAVNGVLRGVAAGVRRGD